MRIALDAMGGDDAPVPNVDGALAALERDEQLEVLLVGEQDVLESLLAERDVPEGRLTVVPAEGFVGMEEKPTQALRAKPNCSIAVCWKLMATQEADAVVSAGNTGAVVAAGLRTRLFLKGVKRPGIAVALPTAKGKSVLLDVGANPAARPEHLLQYAVMGNVYAREMLGIEDPRIGLMNIGSEEGKGNELYRESHALLAESHVKDRYLGNVEGRGLYQGEADVVVCEGFVGNVVLKVSEGFASFMMKAVAGHMMQAMPQQQAEVGSALKDLARNYEYSETGGALLLGIDGVCLICHGSSDHRSIGNALRLATQCKDRRINALITEELAAATAAAATE